MALILVVASVIAVIQARSSAARLVFARLERGQMDALSEMSARARLRPILAEEMTGANATKIPFDGTPFEMSGDDWHAEIRLNDVAGLVDLYFASDVLLEMLPGGAGLVERRPNALSELPPGQRFPAEEASLARFGADSATRRAMEGLVTQSGVPGAMNALRAPSMIRAAVANTGLVGSGPVRSVLVRIQAIH